jgi:hypothetical protein
MALREKRPMPIAVPRRVESATPMMATRSVFRMPTTNAFQ